MRFLISNVRPLCVSKSVFYKRPCLSIHARRLANIPKTRALVPLKPEEVKFLDFKLSPQDAVRSYLIPGQNDGQEWYKEPSPFAYNTLPSFGIFSQYDDKSEQSVKAKEIEQLNVSIKSVFRKIKQIKNEAHRQQFETKLRDIINDTASGIFDPNIQQHYHDLGRVMLESMQQRLKLLENSLSDQKEHSNVDSSDLSFEKQSLIGGPVDLNDDIFATFNLDLNKVAEMATSKDPNKIEKLYRELEESFLSGTAFKGPGTVHETLPDWQSTLYSEFAKNRPIVLDIFPNLEGSMRKIEKLQHDLNQKIQEKGEVNFPALQYLVTMEGMRKLLQSRYDTDRPLNINDSLILDRMKAIDPELFQHWWKGPEDALSRMSATFDDEHKKLPTEKTPTLPKSEPKPNPLANYVISDEPMTVENLPPTAKDYEDYLDVYMKAPLVRPPDIRQPFSTRNLWYHLLDDAEGLRVLKKRWYRRWKRFRKSHPHSGYYQEDLLTKTYPDKTGFVVRTLNTESNSLMKHFVPARFPVLGVSGWTPPWESHAYWNNYARQTKPFLGWLPYRWVITFWILLALLCFIFNTLLGGLWDEMERRVNIPLYFLVYHSWRVAENFMFAGTIFPQPGMETELVHLLGKPIVADMSLLTAFTYIDKSIMITAPIYGRDRKAVATIELNAKKRGLFKYDWRLSPVIVDFEDGTRVIVDIPEEWALLTPERMEEWKATAASGKPDDWSRQFNDPLTDHISKGAILREWPNTSGYLAIPYEPRPPSADQQ